jgi:hypothetical protein
MNLVDRSFIQWERLNQPRRARARLVVLGPTVCAVSREDLRPRKAAPSPELGSKAADGKTS